MSFNPTFVSTKNFLMNGAFHLSQRATNFGLTGIYTLDRWYCDSSGAGTFSVAPQTDVDSLSDQAMRFNCGAGGGAGYINVLQPIEASLTRRLNGRICTLSIWAKRDSNFSSGSMNLGVLYSSSLNNKTAAGAIASKTISYSSISTSSYTKFSLTFTCLDYATAKTIMPYFGVASLPTNGTLDVKNAQLEIGAQATSFQYFGGHISSDTFNCMRFYETYGKTPGNGSGTPTVQGGMQLALGFNTVASGDLYANIPFKAPKFKAPTLRVWAYASPFTLNTVSNLAGTNLATGSGTPSSPSVGELYQFFIYNNSGGAITPTSGGVFLGWDATSEI